jgi:hypothetical protein
MKTEEQYAKTETEYATMRYQQAVVIDKESKTKENITLLGLPTQDEFPGGTDWVNDEGELIENPFWRMAINYALYYEFGARRRSGERVFTMLHRPPQAERGAPQMKASTATKKLVEAWQREGRSEAWIEKMLVSMNSPE